MSFLLMNVRFTVVQETETFWLVPQLERMNLVGKVWFQQDGAPHH
jgi:hypothetical protein